MRTKGVPHQNSSQTALLRFMFGMHVMQGSMPGAVVWGRKKKPFLPCAQSALYWEGIRASASVKNFHPSKEAMLSKETNENVSAIPSEHPNPSDDSASSARLRGLPSGPGPGTWRPSLYLGRWHLGRRLPDQDMGIVEKSSKRHRYTFMPKDLHTPNA